MLKNNENFQLNHLHTQNKPSILVVTPFSELGEIICESLKEVTYIEHFQDASKAISFLSRTENCKQVILDMELGEVPLLDLGRALRLINHGIKFIIISKEQPSNDLDEIQPWKFLRRPLLLRDLQIALGLKTPDENNPVKTIDLDSFVTENQASMHWSNNPALATRYLARLIEKSFAQEALLIQDQTLWSYAGRLPQESVNELDKVITKSCVGRNIADFIRFIRLNSTQTEHSLYATLLAVGVILALVFDPEIPLDVVRRQTHKLADTLLLLDSEEEQIKILSSGDLETERGVDKKTDAWLYLDGSPSNVEHDDQEIGSLNYSSNKPLSAFLSSQRIDEMSEKTPDPDIFNKSEIPMPREESVDLTNLEREIADKTTEGLTQSEKNQTTLTLDILSDCVYDLTYSSLLIPRFSTHRLTKDRENLIKDCVKKVHTSFGWRLEELEVQPDYLRWAFCIPPTLPLKKYLDTIRKETSKRLFDDFPPYKEENLSDDYWAPGFLIMGGKKSISDQLVLAYTKQNRQKQGLWTD